MNDKLKVGVLISGSGTNLQAIIDAAAEGLPVEIVHVISSRPDAYGIERAKAAGIGLIVTDIFKKRKSQIPIPAKFSHF